MPIVVIIDSDDILFNFLCNRGKGGLPANCWMAA